MRPSYRRAHHAALDVGLDHKVVDDGGENIAEQCGEHDAFWLQELKDEGLIRHLGLTNVDTAHLRVIVHSGIDIVSNQVCFSLLDQRAAHGMTEFCVEHGIKLLAFGTVAGGFLTERWLGKPEPDVDKLENWSLMKYKRFIDQAGGWDVFQHLLETLERVAQKHQVQHVHPISLTNSPRNARTHSRKQIRQIADSIRRFGFTNPI